MFLSENSVFADASSPQSIPPTLLLCEVVRMICCELQVEGSLPSELLPAQPPHARSDHLGLMVVGADFVLTVWGQGGRPHL